MRAALYARVSTGRQDEEMQLREQKEFCKHRKWITEIFADAGQSGAKVSRPELDRMMALCRHRKFDVVVVYRFDRFARSLKQLIDALEEFNSLGIQFVSLHEQVDTSIPAGKLLFHIMGALSEFERSLIRERVISGLANARAKGKRLGRPPRNADVEQIRALRRSGASWRAIAKQMGIPVSPLRRALLKAKIAYQKGVPK